MNYHNLVSFVIQSEIFPAFFRIFSVPFDRDHHRKKYFYRYINSIDFIVSVFDFIFRLQLNSSRENIFL